MLVGRLRHVSVAQALADAGLERRRHSVVVLDELWQALRVGAKDGPMPHEAPPAGMFVDERLQA